MHRVHSIRRNLCRAACGLGVATLLLLLVVHFTPLTTWYASWLAGDWTDATGDTLIVLASEIESDGILGPTTFVRTHYALMAWREHPFRTIIVTGGRDPESPVSTGRAMRDFLVENGVPASVVRVDYQARSTHENALFAKKLLPPDPGKVVLMTSDFHMFRAHRVFEKAGVHVVPRPVPDVLKRSNHLINRWTAFCIVVGETAKIAYYAWSRWI